MTRWVRSVTNFLRREDGVTAVECALMLALIVVVCIVALNSRPSATLSAQPVVAEKPAE